MQEIKLVDVCEVGGWLHSKSKPRRAVYYEYNINSAIPDLLMSVVTWNQSLDKLSTELRRLHEMRKVYLMQERKAGKCRYVAIRR